MVDRKVSDRETGQGRQGGRVGAGRLVVVEKKWLIQCLMLESVLEWARGGNGGGNGGSCHRLQVRLSIENNL